MNLYCVHDSATGVLDSPFLAMSDLSAIRTFKIILSGLPSVAYDDLSLRCVAQFDVDWNYIDHPGLSEYVVFSGLDYKLSLVDELNNKVSSLVAENKRLTGLLNGVKEDE